MINQSLIDPKSIVIVGGSNNIKKPGGKVLQNIMDGGFKGDLFVVNKGETSVQGIKSYSNVSELGKVDLAIISIPANYCLEAIKVLAETKNTKAFIILSAGFGETSETGKELERKVVDIVKANGGCLVGPNCIGVLNLNYNGIFTTPIPKMNPKGCDLISSSGATAVFLMEAGIPLGLTFANIYSVGNAAQLSVEDVLEYMDLNFDLATDSSIKLLYLESIHDTQKLLKHAASLVRKGAKIAAIKAGSSEAGSRAAASHTGAISNSDVTVRALFEKAGIVYCSSREELISVASIFNYKELIGENIAVITHAGGSAVMLTDALSIGGLNVPPIEGENANKLLSFLHPGSSVANPIDFLATGTAEQLGIIIDYCEHKLDHIDAMIVVFGSPGLFDVENVYNVLSVKLDVCSKPIYPVLPSVINAQKEIQGFLSKGHINFPDEVVLGRALSAVYNTQAPQDGIASEIDIDHTSIRKVIDQASDGFLAPKQVDKLIDAVGIPRVSSSICTSEKELSDVITTLNYPVVMKVIGPVHKSDIGGVILNVKNNLEVTDHFKKLMELPEVEGVLIQPMISGVELFLGAKREAQSEHVILCGLGGIFIEVLNDFAACLTPVSEKESFNMIHKLKGFSILEGIRGKKGIDIELFAEIIQRLSALVESAPEILEMDINPLLGEEDHVTAVDTRIRIQKF